VIRIISGTTKLNISGIAAGVEMTFDVTVEVAVNAGNLLTERPGTDWTNQLSVSAAVFFPGTIGAERIRICR
jgi:hypothetical protein